MPKLKDLCKKCPESTIQFSKSGKSPYFQNSFLWLIDYISFNIDTTYTYYISNNWKLSQDFAELLQYELRYLREELWAHEQFSFFSPQPLHGRILHAIILVWVFLPEPFVLRHINAICLYFNMHNPFVINQLHNSLETAKAIKHYIFSCQA